MKNNTLSLLKDSGIVAFLILFPHFVPLPFYSYAVVCLGIIWLLLRNDGRTFKNIGLDKNAITIRAIVAGIASALAWVIFMQFIYIPSIKHLFIVTDYKEYDFIKDSPSTLIIIIVAAWLIGGFYEEIVFRGYIQSIWEKRIPGRLSMPLSIISTSVLFGLYHWQQDKFGVLAAFLGGLYWGFLYKRSNDNLWVSIISHAAFDTFTLILIYTGKFGNFY